MADSILDIQVQTLKRVDIATVKGRVDSSTAPKFEGALNQIMDNGRHNIVMELSEANYMSSAGLRIMVATLRECKKNRGDVRLAKVSDRVFEVLSLAGLDSLFQIYENETQAVGSF